MHELAMLIRYAVQIEVILVFARILLSWFPGIPPWHPLVRMLATVTDPVLLPFRRIIPPLGGLDFSPIIAIVVLQLVGGFVADVVDTGASGYSAAYTITNAVQHIVDGILIILVIIVGLRLILSVFKVSP